MTQVNMTIHPDSMPSILSTGGVDTDRDSGGGNQLRGITKLQAMDFSDYLKQEWR